MKRIWFLILIIWLGFGQINSASAHGLEAGQLSILIDDVNAAIIVAPYASAFSFADDNGDGLLSTVEVDTHQDAIHAFIEERIVLRNEVDTAATIQNINVIVPDETATGTGDPARADFVQVSVWATWSSVPESIDVEYTLFGSAEERIHFLMQDRATGEVMEGEFHSAETVVSLRGEDVSIATDDAIWLSGIEHVLSGYDHILFILALVLATTGLRKLLIPLTAFTLAHTVTLAAVAFGFEPPVPAWLIEATIAASIAILAGIYLFGISVEVWWVAALLGLVHGLGFGQAMTDSLGSLQQWGSALIAITIGVELTHLAIALVGIGSLWLIRKPQHNFAVRSAASIVIFCIGLYWTLERIPISLF
ncbi:MAG: HupE/UreJ family protein [Chloroflexota bacterium]